LCLETGGSHKAGRDERKNILPGLFACRHCRYSRKKPARTCAALVNRLFGPHPGIFAFLLGGGAFLMFYFGYVLFLADSTSQWNRNLSAAWNWALFLLGAVMWLAGGILFGRNYGVNGFLSLALHLCLPVIGLGIVRLLGKRFTPRDAWVRENRGLDEKAAKRNYRPMKPLY
jgi:hypothetical protein